VWWTERFSQNPRSEKIGKKMNFQQLVALMSLFFHYYCLHVTGGFRQFMTMKLMENRKLATIRRIKSIRSIPGADKIVCSEIDGWTAVVKKGQFEEGFLKGTSMLR
jgi:hypothetical protein